MTQSNVPKFHHRDSRTHLGIIAWLPAGYDPEKPQPVSFGYGKSTLWAYVRQGLELKVGWTVLAEAVGEGAATLLVTDVIAKSSLTPPTADSSDDDTQQ